MAENNTPGQLNEAQTLQAILDGVIQTGAAVSVLTEVVAKFISKQNGTSHQGEFSKLNDAIEMKEEMIRKEVFKVS
jgi:hypothetical protein